MGRPENAGSARIRAARTGHEGDHREPFIEVAPTNLPGAGLGDTGPGLVRDNSGDGGLGWRRGHQVVGHPGPCP